MCNNLYFSMFVIFIGKAQKKLTLIEQIQWDDSTQKGLYF